MLRPIFPVLIILVIAKTQFSVAFSFSHSSSVPIRIMDTSKVLQSLSSDVCFDMGNTFALLIVITLLSFFNVGFKAVKDKLHLKYDMYCIT